MFLQLYQETQNQRYIQEAERAICLMLPQMIKTECGVGWNPESVDVRSEEWRMEMREF